MAHKKPAPQQSGVSKEILAEAKRSVVTDNSAPAPMANCVVCGEDVAPNSSEELCWVCRRLKISAWKESDQMPLQE